MNSEVKNILSDSLKVFCHKDRFEDWNNVDIENIAGRINFSRRGVEKWFKGDSNPLPKSLNTLSYYILSKRKEESAIVISDTLEQLFRAVDQGKEIEIINFYEEYKKLYANSVTSESREDPQLTAIENENPTPVENQQTFISARKELEEKNNQLVRNIIKKQKRLTTLIGGLLVLSILSSIYFFNKNSVLASKGKENIEKLEQEKVYLLSRILETTRKDFRPILGIEEVDKKLFGINIWERYGNDLVVIGSTSFNELIKPHGVKKGVGIIGCAADRPKVSIIYHKDRQGNEVILALENNGISRQIQESECEIEKIHNEPTRKGLLCRTFNEDAIIMCIDVWTPITLQQLQNSALISRIDSVLNTVSGFKIDFNPEYELRIK